MSIRNGLLPVAFVVLFLSCKSADNKVPEIAAGFCDCFTVAEKELSQSTIDVFIRASKESNPQEALKKELRNLNREEQLKFNNEMTSFGQVENQQTSLGLCIKNIERKYGNAFTINQKKFGEKLVKELESKDGCSLTAAILKMGLKMGEKK